MFLKVLKYDFSFSAVVFFTLAAILLGVSVILRFTLPIFLEVDSAVMLSGVMSFALGLLIVGVAIASITQIFQFFYKNFFGPTGYAMLTLPVTKGKLLFSKLLVSIIWFNFMMAVVVLSMVILWSTAASDIRGSGVLSLIGPSEIVLMLTLNQLALFAVTLLFLCITLAHSIIANKKVHGVISGVLGFGYGWLYVWVTNEVTNRGNSSLAMQTLDGRWYQEMPLMGLRYGRIAIHTPEFGWPVYIDIFMLGLSVAFSAVAIIATYYLLKKRMSLR